MNPSQCPHCGKKLGQFLYADACPHCHVELKHNTRPLRSVPSTAPPAEQSSLVRLLWRIARLIES